MHKAHFTCNIELPESIVLCATLVSDYQPIQYSIDEVTRTFLSFEFDASKVESILRDHHDDPYFFANVQVKRLNVTVVIDDLSPDDLLRLQGVHPTDERFVRNSTDEYQAVPQLGERIGLAMIQAVNRVLTTVRDRFGQYWLRTLDTHDQYWPNLFVSGNARWHLGTEDSHPFWPGPPSVIFRNCVLGAADLYLTDNDWNSLDESVSRQADTAFALIADAQNRRRNGDDRIALMQLNSALEWTTQEVVSRYIAARVPEETAKNVYENPLIPV